LAAVDAPEGRHAHAAMTIRRSTVFGHVLVHAIELAENSIFSGQVRAARRQRGCMRFCYVPRDSRTPRRYNCQPDLTLVAVAASGVSAGDRASAEAREEARVRPRFNSVRYGTAEYGQLARACAAEIT